jgi:hypothetical protein
MDDRDVKQPPAFSRRDPPEGSSGFPSNRRRRKRGMERREALYSFHAGANKPAQFAQLDCKA